MEEVLPGLQPEIEDHLAENDQLVDTIQSIIHEYVQTHYPDTATNIYFIHNISVTAEVDAPDDE